ncbi:patatin family protein [Granulosicoccus sp.]|nr:patatin family protein [Granulosicoccus sp.]MDB4223968.1 patatin family protein [Granulosicoccus sp.]
MASIDTAIVTEGGGQRGIYTAGVLDIFLAEQFNPFNIGCGVSAGAQNLLTYYLRQPGYAKRAILELTAADDFLVPYRWMAARNIIDLDGYFERTLRDPDYWLPYQGVNDVQRLNTLQFVATDKHSLEPIYLQPDELSVISSLKASCAVPILYKSGVRIGERILVDGSVADPLPVQHAYELGARRILLIRTVHRNSLANYALWRRRIESARKLLIAPTKLLDMLERHETAMTKTWSFIHSPPKNLELIVIQPQSPLRSRVFSSRPDALLADYEQGRRDGQSAIHELKHWLEPLSS